MNLEIWKKAKKSLGITFDELAKKTNIAPKNTPKKHYLSK